MLGLLCSSDGENCMASLQLGRATCSIPDFVYMDRRTVLAFACCERAYEANATPSHVAVETRHLPHDGEGEK
jgi:hypothetical protein